jgi:putative ABC transport system ATP-binding protein
VTAPRAMVRLRGARKTFNAGTPEEVCPMRGIDLAIADGDFVIVLGGNGSGKSTMLNSLAGTFRLDEGSIEIDGEDVTGQPEHRRARLVGRVFQNPFSGTAPFMSIAENFAMAARRGQVRGLGWALGRGFRDELRDRVGELRMGLEDRLETAIGALSGGQRQALTLLMATWRKPKLLLLDEHTAALDQVLALTRSIVAEHKLTTLMVTHAMSQAVSLGSRIVMMHKGQVLHDVSGSDKKRLRVDDLLGRFEDVRRRELLDEGAATLLSQTYV